MAVDSQHEVISDVVNLGVCHEAVHHADAGANQYKKCLSQVRAVFESEPDALTSGRQTVAASMVCLVLMLLLSIVLLFLLLLLLLLLIKAVREYQVAAGLHIKQFVSFSGKDILMVVRADEQRLEEEAERMGLLMYVQERTRRSIAAD